MADGNTLWHGRFEGNPNQALRELNDSLPFDRRMFKEDIAGSRAHVEMLCEVGLLTQGELSEILDALMDVEKKYRRARSNGHQPMKISTLQSRGEPRSSRPQPRKFTQLEAVMTR